MQPFVVLGLPRSRTAWLSHFLTYGPWHCGHEELRHMRSLEDAKSWLSQPFTGSCETALAPFWRTLLKLRPDVKVVVVRRGIEGPIRSLKAIPETNWDDAQLVKQMTKLDRKLDQIVKRVPGVLEVRFEDLATEETCKLVFEHCLGLPHDSARWQQLSKMNIQCSMPAILRYFAAHQPQLWRFAEQVKQQTLADLWLR